MSIQAQELGPYICMKHISRKTYHFDLVGKIDMDLKYTVEYVLLDMLLLSTFPTYSYSCDYRSYLTWWIPILPQRQFVSALLMVLHS